MSIILLAAADDQRRRRLCRIVDTAGYTMAGISDSFLLLRLLRSAPEPYVVVLDLDGFTRAELMMLTLLVQERWLMPSHAYVLCTSQQAWEMPALQSMRATLVADVLPTPFAASTLIHSVAQAMRQLEMRAALPLPAAVMLAFPLFSYPYDDTATLG